jgi:hypothetical protein
VAEIRRGFTTGVNEFFCLTGEEIAQKGIEKRFWMHKDRSGKGHPNKVIVSPKEGRHVLLYSPAINKHLISIDKEKAKLRNKQVWNYIKTGEAKGYHDRGTCKARKPWYSIKRRKPWPLLYPMIHNDRQAVFLNRDRVQVDHNLFEIKPKPGQPLIPLLCFLLSTVSILI